MDNNASVHSVASPQARFLPAVCLAGKNDRYILSNGVEIPCLGYGTYMVPNNKVGEDALRGAVEMGFRHIDTATSYHNEDMVGRVIAESGIPRGEFFITSKLNNPDQGYESTLEAFERSLAWLGTDYLDLYIIHRFDYEHPIEETMEALNDLVKAGKVRALGASASSRSCTAREGFARLACPTSSSITSRALPATRA